MVSLERSFKSEPGFQLYFESDLQLGGKQKFNQIAYSNELGGADESWRQTNVEVGQEEDF